MIIIPNEMQMKVLNKPSDKNICLIMNGAGAGNSMALLLAAINHKSDFCWFITHEQARINHLKWLEKVGFRISWSSCIATLGSKRIKFTGAVGLDDLRETQAPYFVDIATKRVIDAVLSRAHTGDIYIVAPIHGNTSVVRKVVNDKLEIDYEKSTPLLPLFNVSYQTRLHKEDIKSDIVHLVTGSSVYDNFHLKTNNPRYVDSLQTLPYDMREGYLNGNW